MQIEIEKKYHFTALDYAIIKDKATFISDTKVIDYYLDTADLILFKADHKLRLRNGLYELKIWADRSNTRSSRSIEIEDEEEIDTILQEKFKLTTDDVTGKLEIITQVEKYKYLYKNHEIIFDIQRYQYWERYEVEICLENDVLIDGDALIEWARTDLGLMALEQTSIEAKWVVCAMHQNIALYELLISQK